jgi:2-haloacid dehalogenase
MVSRRDLICVGASLAGGLLTPRAASGASTAPHFAAVAFDGFAVFNPAATLAEIETHFPNRGAAVYAAWRTKLFEYTWLRTIMGRYASFPAVAADALFAVAAALGLELNESQGATLVDGLSRMTAWSDMPSALATLRRSGLRLAILSDLTQKMMASNLARSEMADFFDRTLSTDAVQAFKPHPAAYQMGVDAFGLDRQQVLYVALAGWDASGAKAFGYPTFWLNRLQQPPETLGARPDASGGIAELMQYALS